ncbi:protein phosphatase [Streptomyces carminius]|uniref:Protein phosphatase n=1 Tax=Streptomyces carminius TaxID=2665496 RepID=A0A2M8MBP1_9ACTN|nr:PP2C family protein-serine/threonine phosphatase [Streptomyces carminius]PJF01634.1 protein phosphatase [Streptomyces carminius]
MADERFGLGEILAAAEDAAPVESIDVIARNLRDRFGAVAVSFLFLDLVGRELVRLTEEGEPHGGRGADRIGLRDSVHDEVLRTQRLIVTPDGRGGQQVIAPVTNRGDTIGVLELTLPHAGEDVLEQVGQAAHALAYIIVTDRRFTDLYLWGQRTTAVSLAAEIQHQLLPTASCCEAAQFTLAGALAPAEDIGGDTFDYALDRETLHLSVTDAMGHNVDSALLATLLVNASRGARRAGCDLAEQARQTHQALLDHGRGTLATGQLLRVSLDGTGAQLVNAGHPWPLLLRDGAVREVPLDVNLPFGVPAPRPHRVQDLDLRPGDRLMLYTDGVQERAAGTVDLSALLSKTRYQHPRETVRALVGAVMDACHGQLADDATVLCLDWHGPGPGGRHTQAGADTGDPLAMDTRRPAAGDR